LTAGRPKHIGDGEAASPFGESQGQYQAARRGGKNQSEAELDSGEPGQADRGQAGADGAAGGGDVGDRRRCANRGFDPIGDGCGVVPAGVDKERSDGVGAGALGDVAGVGDEEAVFGCRGKFSDDAVTFVMLLGLTP
jgi:hypothetical protein